MKPLIVAATLAEISPLMAYFKLPQKEFVQSLEFDIAITGVGMTATAYTLGRLLSPKYNLVLNLGIAGSFDNSISPGMVVNITTDEFSELGAEDLDTFIGIGALGFGKSKYSAFNNLLHDELSKVKKVSGITVNCVHGNEKSIKLIKDRLSPVTESMEGAAVLYCCEQAAIPCLQIRSISNYVEPRNRSTWEIDLAIKNLNDWAIRFLTNT